MAMLDKNYFKIENNKEILAKCRKCGMRTQAADFKLDDQTGMMVCPNCYEGSRLKGQNKSATGKSDDNLLKTISQPREVKTEEMPKTLIIRNEDDLFRENSNQRIRENREEAKHDPRERYICDKCGFAFRYNPIKDWPRVCPACSKPLKNIKRSFF